MRSASTRSSNGGEAVTALERLDDDLLKERMAYMKRCKDIRKIKADEFDSASDRGISKKC